jgi:hypothetical protein
VVDALVRILPILKRPPALTGGLLLVVTGGLLVRPDYFWVLLALTGAVSMDQAVNASSPSGGQLAVGALAMVGGTLLLLSPLIPAWPTKPSALVALRHQSFDGNSRPLEPADLPPELKGVEIVPLDVDQSFLFEQGVLKDPKAALLLQRDLPSRLGGLLRAHPRAKVAYCGKAHIPLAFAAAHLALSEVRLSYFELDRDKAGWRALREDGSGPDLGLRTDKVDGSSPSGEAVVRVEISYAISDDDVAAVVSAPAAQVRIAIAQPRIDCVTTAAQVEAVAAALRQVLDDLQAWPRPINRIHVFIAAPMSVVVAMARRVSPTIHKPIVVHNYSGQTTPRYAWGVEVNAAGGPRVVENVAGTVA